MDNNGGGWVGGVKTGGRWGGLGVRLGWGEKAENCTRTTIKLEKKNKEAGDISINYFLIDWDTGT